MIRYRSKVLVVDGSESMRLMIREILRNGNYDVTTAVDGLAALKTIEEHCPPDVVVTDLEMIPMSGWALIERLGASERTSAIPIIVVSGSAKIKDLSVGRVFAKFRKPFSVGDFVAAVAAATKTVALRQSQLAMVRPAANVMREKIDCHRRRYGLNPLSSEAVEKIVEILVGVPSAASRLHLVYALRDIISLMED